MQTFVSFSFKRRMIEFESTDKREPRVETVSASHTVAIGCKKSKNSLSCLVNDIYTSS